MPWWGWMILGAVLLGSELLVSTEFYLAVMGVAAILTGILVSMGLAPPTWLPFASFGALSAVGIVFFRRRLIRRFPSDGVAPGKPLIGEWARPVARIEAGASGAVMLRGTRWQARNVGEEAVGPEADARVVGVSGVVLEIRG